MTTEKKPAVSLVKQPFFIAIVLIALAIGIIWATQKPSTSVDQSSVAAGDSTNPANADGDFSGIQLKPPTTASAGQNTPSIVQSMAGAPEEKKGRVTAPGLESLVAGMEAKVAADPTVNNRMLLAQTYNELGMQDKALTALRDLKKENPKNGRISLILSSILSRSNDEQKIKESLSLLDGLSEDKTVQQYLVNMYKGDALIRKQDHKGALKHWKLALEDMPLADNRRAILEKRITDLSSKDQKPDDSKSSKG
jgi:predicted negative regulator of RcsB-dependent stress response